MNIADELKKVFSQKTCVVGMGNTLRGDDAAGVMVAQRLGNEPSLTANVTVINVEDVLESYTFKIAQGDFQNILIVDAVQEEGSAPGELVFGKLDEMEENCCDYSTHKLSIAISEKVFKQFGKDAYLLGIVAGNLDYGAPLSNDVAGCVESVIDIIRTAGSN